MMSEHVRLTAREAASARSDGRRYLIAATKTFRMGDEVYTDGRSTVKFEWVA